MEEFYMDVIMVCKYTLSVKAPGSLIDAEWKL